MFNKVTGLKPENGKSTLSTQDVTFQTEIEKRERATQTGNKKKKTAATSGRYTVNDNNHEKKILVDGASMDLEFDIPVAKKDLPDLLKVKANIRSRNEDLELIVKDISLQYKDSDPETISLKIPEKHDEDITIAPDKKKGQSHKPAPEVKPRQPDKNIPELDNNIISNENSFFPGLPPKTIQILFNYYQDAAYYIIFVRFLREFMENERKLFEYLRRRLIDYAIENEISQISFSIDKPSRFSKEIDQTDIPFYIFQKMKGS